MSLNTKQSEAINAFNICNQLLDRTILKYFINIDELPEFISILSREFTETKELKLSEVIDDNRKTNRIKAAIENAASYVLDSGKDISLYHLFKLHLTTIVVTTVVLKGAEEAHKSISDLINFFINNIEDFAITDITYGDYGKYIENNGILEGNKNHALSIAG